LGNSGPSRPTICRFGQLPTLLWPEAGGGVLQEGEWFYVKNTIRSKCRRTIGIAGRARTEGQGGASCGGAQYVEEARSHGREAGAHLHAPPNSASDGTSEAMHRYSSVNDPD
jgi:hypothetical protein